MPPHQHRLGLAVAALLAQVGPERRTPVMPDERRRAEADAVAAFLQAPANVHVVAGAMENGIEAADLHQGPFVKGHVAAGNVFGLTVGQHDVRGSARRNHHGRRHGGIIRRQKIVAAHSDKRALQQIATK